MTDIRLATGRNERPIDDLAETAMSQFQRLLIGECNLDGDTCTVICEGIELWKVVNRYDDTMTPLELGRYLEEIAARTQPQV